MNKNSFALTIYLILSLIFWGIPMHFDFINNLNISGDTVGLIC